MARKKKTMKAVTAPKGRNERTATLVIQVDPLAVGRGHRNLPRTRVHDSARQPSRARSKQQWRRQIATTADGGGRSRRLASAA